MKYCSNCGNKLKEGADVCLNCGQYIIKNNASELIDYKKQSKNGKSVASLILGSISIFWSLLMVISLPLGIETVSYYYNIVEILAFCFGYSLFAFIPSIISLILGGFSLREKKSGISLAGIITSALSLFICAFSFFILIAKLLVKF